MVHWRVETTHNYHKTMRCKITENRLLHQKTDENQGEMGKKSVKQTNTTLPYELQNIVMHTVNIHNHFTRISSNSGLFIHQMSSTNFGSHPMKFMAYVWNNFSRVQPQRYAILIVLRVVKTS